jgi:3-oxoadipate enol-lactonase
MAEMTINYEVFNVLVEGPDEAPALILSNSLGTNLHMWDRQIPALIERFKVVRYDSRGHGKSIVADGPYSIEQLGADALAIMDALNIDTAHWLGLSKGGMVGQWLLIHAPHRIERAILANTASHMPPPDFWNERIRSVRNAGMESITSSVLDRWFTGDFQTRDPEAVEAVKEMLLTTPAEGYAASCAAIRDLDMREALRTVDKPVMVIVGKHDPATPPDHGQLIADTIPGARLVTLDTAHLSNIEAAEAFNEAVVSFLTEAPAVRSAPRRSTTPRAKSVTQKSKAAPKAPQPRAATKRPTAVTPRRPAAKKTAKAKAASKKTAQAKGSARKSKRTAPASKTAAIKRRAAAKVAAKKSAKKTGTVKARVPKKSPKKSLSARKQPSKATRKKATRKGRPSRR